MKDIRHRPGPFFNVAPPPNSVSAIFDSDAERGAVVYISGDGHVDLAQANSDPQARTVGLAAAAVVAGEHGEYITSGPITNEGWNLTPGAVYFLDPLTPGGITPTCPTGNGQYVVTLGMATTPTQLNVEINHLLGLGT